MFTRQLPEYFIDIICELVYNLWMTNLAPIRISEAHQGGYLRAAFVDCQGIEYYEDIHHNFTQAQKLAIALRTESIPLSHFIYRQNSEVDLTPFLYQDRNINRIPSLDIDFKIVIPDPNEIVLPKTTYNGFTSPHSRTVVGNTKRNIPKDQKSALICAGFTARCCLMETAIGSFKKAANPEHHRVIIALDATNIHPNYYEGYAIDFLAKADEDIRDKISFATTEQIIAATQSKTTPSQSSPARPCMV